MNPADYQPEADADNYYNQFDDSVLSETVTESVSDAEGNTIFQTGTTTCGKNKARTVTLVPCIITKLLNLVNIFLKVHGTNVGKGWSMENKSLQNREIDYKVSDELFCDKEKERFKNEIQ